MLIAFGNNRVALYTESLLPDSALLQQSRSSIRSTYWAANPARQLWRKATKVIHSGTGCKAWIHAASAQHSEGD